jgi:hypothetical protein
MSDRTIYFPDLDWPSNAPANYVPIKEGGGASQHGSGTAVGEISLGGRTIRAINLYGHTPGSVGFLDAENNMILTSDAIGSGCVWAHFGPISRYAESLRHLQDVLRPMNNPAILPGHFYQISSGARAKGPVSGRPLDKQYVTDQLAAAEGVLSGKIAGEPYAAGGRNVLVARVGSAEMTFTQEGSGAAPAPPKSPPAAPPPANFTGTWIGRVQLPTGVYQVTLSLQQKGEEVTGAIATPSDSYPIQKVKLSGDKLAFEVVADQLYAVDCMREGDRITGEIKLTDGSAGKIDVSRTR